MPARHGWFILMLASAGCSGSSNAPPQVAATPTATVAETPVSVVAQIPITSFADAVTETTEEEQQPPPDRTLTGQPTAKLRERVQALWDQVTFTSQAGKRLECTATLTTDLGAIVMTLRPDAAPNHVRNFIALARAGYYDGLCFEQIVEQATDDGGKLELIEAGCPLGTGEPGVGHLGYWLKSEFSEQVKHAPGSVGACRGDGPDSAACRFYITLSPVAAMDGNFTVFGQVTRGLDVARKIMQSPRAEGSSRPEKPTVIRSVTIDCRDPSK